MSQPSGAYVVRCRFCGQPYNRTNWMIRRNVRSADGTWLRDTHEISCYEKQQRAKQLLEEEADLPRNPKPRAR